MRRSQRRSVAVIADTPEPNGNFSIVEDSVFDDSQVPDTVERSKRFDVSKSLRFRLQSRGRNLPSVLPGEETFVCQSQRGALSSTAAEGEIEFEELPSASYAVASSSSSGGKISQKKPPRRKSRARNRESFSSEGMVQYLLQKERTPSPTPSISSTSKARLFSSPRASARLSLVSAQFPLSSDEEPSPQCGPPRHNDHSQVGSVQKFLTKAKPVQAGQQNRDRKKTTKTTKTTKTRRVPVARKLAEDLKGTSLVNDSIAEEASSSKSSSGPIDPGLLANSYANFSSDSAKALIAAMEAGEHRASSRPVSQTSSGSNISVSESCVGLDREDGKGSEGPDDLDTTSLTPVDMEAATPLTVPDTTRSAPSGPERPARPVLEGVNVYVEFRTGADNRGASVKALARELGATVSERLTSTVTHVIFKDGSLPNYKKAQRLGLYIVAFSWLDGSRKTGRRLEEKDHPSVSKEKYDSPGLFPKIRKVKSMQPKTMEEDFESASKSLNRKLKIQARKQILDDKSKSDSKSAKLAPAAPPSSRKTPSSLDRLTRAINSPGAGVVTPVRARPALSPILSPSSQDVDTPLAERLAARLLQTSLHTAVSPVAEVSQVSQVTTGTEEELTEKRKTRGRKRKAESEESSVRVLSDVSNSVQPVKSKRHRLFPSTSSQRLDITTDNRQPAPIGNIENVHLTGKKNCEKTSSTSYSLTRTRNSVVEKVQSKRKVRSGPTQKSAAAISARRSVNEFQHPSKSQSSVEPGKRKVVGYIAMTQMEKEDRSLAQELSRRFGVLGYRSSVTSETTHLVCGQNKRTINTLKAMLRGCWILTREWLLESLEEGHWAEENKYELVAFSPAVKLLREERQTFRGVFQSDLFKDVGPVYISSKCRVERGDLRQLVQLGGGKVVNTARVAAVVVGELCHVGDSNSPQFVTDLWILDSVQHHNLLPFLDYPLH